MKYNFVSLLMNIFATALNEGLKFSRKGLK